MPTAILLTLLAVGQINGDFKPPGVDFPAVAAETSPQNSTAAPAGIPANAPTPSAGLGLPVGTGATANGTAPMGNFPTGDAPAGNSSAGNPIGPSEFSNGLRTATNVAGPSPEGTMGAAASRGSFQPTAPGEFSPNPVGSPPPQSPAALSLDSPPTGTPTALTPETFSPPTTLQPAPLNLQNQPAGVTNQPTAITAQPTLSTPPSFQPGAVPSNPVFSAQPTSGVSAAAQPISSSATATRAEALSRQQPRNAAEAILQEMLSEAAMQTFQGEPITLVEAMSRVDDSAGRLELVKKYWVLSAAVAWHSVCEEQSNFLREIPQPAGLDQSRLQAAIATADARTREAKLAAVGIQYELAEVTRRPQHEALPLPANLPWVGAYNTRISELFAGQTPPLALKRLSVTLPEFQDVIAAGAEAMLANREYRENALRSFQAGQLSLADLLAAADNAQAESKALLTSARNYNLSIGDYALTVAGSQVDRRTVASMLIPVPDTEKSVLVANNNTVIPASANFPVPPGSSVGSSVRQVQPIAENEGLPAGATVTQIDPNTGQPISSPRIIGQDQPNFGQPISGQPTLAQPPLTSGVRGFRTE